MEREGRGEWEEKRENKYKLLSLLGRKAEQRLSYKELILPQQYFSSSASSLCFTVQCFGLSLSSILQGGDTGFHAGLSCLLPPLQSSSAIVIPQPMALCDTQDQVHLGTFTSWLLTTQYTGVDRSRVIAVFMGKDMQVIDHYNSFINCVLCSHCCKPTFANPAPSSYQRPLFSGLFYH